MSPLPPLPPPPPPGSLDRWVIARVVAGAIDFMAIVVIGWLLYTGRVREEVGLAIFVAIVAGRLRPALGSGTLALLGPLGTLLERYAHRVH